MLNISNTYGGYTYLQSCPCCGGKNTLHYNIFTKSVKCWNAKCDLNQMTDLFSFTKRYSLVESFEAYYGTKLNKLSDSYAVNNSTKIDKAETIDLEAYWELYVPIDFSKANNSINYLTNRGISKENITRFQIGRNKEDDALIIPFLEYKNNTVLNFYQKRNLFPSKYKPKYENPPNVEKKIYNLYSLYPNNTRFCVEGVFDVLYFGDTYFALLGSSFGDRIIDQLVTYAKFNTVLNELVFIPDIGKSNLDYWKYCVKVLNQHLNIKTSIVDLTTGTNFPKNINDGQKIANTYSNGMQFIHSRINKRKPITTKRKNYYFAEQIC